MDISCPVSCNFPHGTLHYQSRPFFSFLVGGSTFFNPHFMYESTRNRGFCFNLTPLLLAQTFLSFTKENKPYQFRSPLLSVSLLISLYRY